MSVPIIITYYNKFTRFLLNMFIIIIMFQIYKQVI